MLARFRLLVFDWDGTLMDSIARIEASLSAAIAACGLQPHPRMLEEIMAEVGLPADEVVMIGDSAFDLEMAHNAGTAHLAACYGVHERGRLAAYRPLAFLNSIAELPALLDSLQRRSGTSRTPRPTTDGTL